MYVMFPNEMAENDEVVEEEDM